MKGQCKSLDRINALPQDTIEKILGLMPIRDALRTSILSREWRYCWTRMPKLVFDDNILSFSEDEQINNNKFVKAIFHVLLLHRGPILELRICLYYITEIFNEIDQIIFHLSRRKNIKRFSLNPIIGDAYYKLPYSFFSLQGLEHLDLRICEFELPLSFNGFSMLKSLIFHKVDIDVNMLQRFLIKCPLLEEFTLTGYNQTEFTGGNRCTFAELFKCLPLIQVLNLSWDYIKHVAAGGMSKKLPTLLVYLRILVLDDVFFHKQDEISSTLCVINSSPNLEKIKMKMDRHARQTFTINLLDLQDYSDLKLDHLKEVEITSFHNYAPEMEFVKLIMAKSPLLKKTRIELDKYVSVDEENKMLRDLVHLQFPRASPAAKFIIQRPKK